MTPTSPVVFLFFFGGITDQRWLIHLTQNQKQNAADQNVNFRFYSSPAFFSDRIRRKHPSYRCAHVSQANSNMSTENAVVVIKQNIEVWVSDFREVSFIYGM